MQIKGCPALIRVVVAVEVSNKPVLRRGIVINAVADSFFPKQSCNKIRPVRLRQCNPRCLGRAECKGYGGAEWTRVWQLCGGRPRLLCASAKISLTQAAGALCIQVSKEMGDVAYTGPTA